MSRLVYLLALIPLGHGPCRMPGPATCTAVPGAGPRVFAELRQARPPGGEHPDTVTVCFVAGTLAGHVVAGYHGELRFGAGVRVVGADHPADGMRVENATAPSRVSFAGVVPAGLRSGPLLTVTLVQRPGDRTPVRLVMLDLTDARGNDVTPQVPVDTIARRPRDDHPE